MNCANADLTDEKWIFFSSTPVFLLIFGCCCSCRLKKPYLKMSCMSFNGSGMALLATHNWRIVKDRAVIFHVHSCVEVIALKIEGKKNHRLIAREFEWFRFMNFFGSNLKSETRAFVKKNDASMPANGTFILRETRFVLLSAAFLLQSRN